MPATPDGDEADDEARADAPLIANTNVPIASSVSSGVGLVNRVGTTDCPRRAPTASIDAAALE
jgi:hypothetical protein